MLGEARRAGKQCRSEWHGLVALGAHHSARWWGRVAVQYSRADLCELWSWLGMLLVVVVLGYVRPSLPQLALSGYTQVQCLSLALSDLLW